MGDSICRDLIETEEDNNPYYLADGGKDVKILNMIISGTARLNVLLPTSTILVFTNFAPLITNDGQCDPTDQWILGFFLALSSFYCVFFSLTDNFRTPKGRLYYGLATFTGIRTLNGEQKKPCAPSDYRLRWADLFHATFKSVAFLTFAASQKDVVECYHPELPRKVTNTVPPLIESVIGTLCLFCFLPRERELGILSCCRKIL